MQSNLNRVANYCLACYKVDKNPLPFLRKIGFDVHFEYANSSNEWFMYNLRSEETNYLFNSLVVIADNRNEERAVERVRVFFQGEEAESL